MYNFSYQEKKLLLPIFSKGTKFSRDAYYIILCKYYKMLARVLCWSSHIVPRGPGNSLARGEPWDFVKKSFSNISLL